MARDDGKKYGAGGSMIQEIVEEPPKPTVKRKSQTKKQENNPTILEERIVDTLPSDVEWEKTEDEK